MQNSRCPTCGHETAPDAACPGCGHAAVNGAAEKKGVKPPPEVASWAIEPVPPEMAEEFRRTFDEAEYTAALREVERGGSHRFEDFIDEIERIAHGQE